MRTTQERDNLIEGDPIELFMLLEKVEREFSELEDMCVDLCNKFYRTVDDIEPELDRLYKVLSIKYNMTRNDGVT